MSNAARFGRIIGIFIGIFIRAIVIILVVMFIISTYENIKETREKINEILSDTTKIENTK